MTRREDFKTLVADVSMGQVGAVFALEVSRLARSNLDWQRLRSILRYRQGRRGRGRGTDHHRWPNAFFAEHGLFSLVAAHDLVCPSSPR
jgi:hypothetical protein